MSLRVLRSAGHERAVQLEFTISIIYWSLILLAPTLILPTVKSEGEPSSAAPMPFRLDLQTDLSLHAAPAVALLFDFIIFERKFSQMEMTRTAPSLAVAMCVWYGCWVEYCATLNEGICASTPFQSSSRLSSES
jgi:hypothetical protein